MHITRAEVQLGVAWKPRRRPPDRLGGLFEASVGDDHPLFRQGPAPCIAADDKVRSAQDEQKLACPYRGPVTVRSTEYGWDQRILVDGGSTPEYPYSGNRTSHFQESRRAL